MSWHRKLPNQAACSSCCGIKEKLQTLWDRTINSILRINQVEPDDQGNIRIRSDNEALTVSEGTNEIVLNLDTSELPAASVISVNGETGAVQLDGSDIPSLYNGTVNSNIYGLWQTKADRTELTTETTNRRNADTALQNNINTLQASIPQEAAAAVAADPTVLSFAAAAADIPNKVDKRTGSGLRAYTHDGSTQDDTPVIDGTTGTTIPIRDSNGRLQAADPAAGATDKTLVTANWVSQTGAGRPNNVIHDTGNETKNGEFTVVNLNNNRQSITLLSGDPTGWKLVYKFPYNTAVITLLIRGRTGTRRNGSPIIVNIAIGSPSQIGDGSSWNTIEKTVLGASSTKQVGLAVRNDNTIGIYYNYPGSEYTQIEMLGTCSIGNSGPMDIRTAIIQEDPTTYTQYVIV